jgi:hypothetical protein
LPKVGKNRENETKQRPLENAPPLDTLGQLPTKGLKTLKKRARSKWWTRAIVGRLLYVESPIHKTYQRAYYCSGVLTQEGQKITTKYCDSRICHICNRIRTAKLMNGYISQFEKLEDLEFTTLTIPNVKADILKETVTDILKTWADVVRVLRERKKINLSGIRKIEITYNSIYDTYHPHLHILSDSNVGDLLIAEWLKRFPNASIKAQNTKKAEQSALNEIFKYTTKIIARQKGITYIYIQALDVIMQALHGRRTFQPFGKIRKIEEDIEQLESIVYSDLPDYEFITWCWNGEDWENTAGEQLTGYKPPNGNDIDFIE